MDSILDQRGSVALEMELDPSEDAQHTQGVNLMGRPILGLAIPPTNGTPTITFEVSVNGGTSWLPLVLDDGSTAAIELTGGAAAFAVSSDLLTPLAGYCGRVGDDARVLVRAAFSAAQTATRTLTWLLVG